MRYVTIIIVKMSIYRSLRMPRLPDLNVVHFFRRGCRSNRLEQRSVHDDRDELIRLSVVNMMSSMIHGMPHARRIYMRVF